MQGSLTLLKGCLRELVILTLCHIACLQTFFFKILNLSFGLSDCPDQLEYLLWVSWISD
jgi:hypothetical protein